MSDPLLGLHAQLACVWEATARKPGNVTRYHDFADLSYLDLVASAAAVAPTLAEAPGRPVGDVVLECVRRTRLVARSNTNLGIVLLLAPLAAAAGGPDLRAGVARVLAGLTVEDARQAFAAIRLAAPGGLGAAPEQDVAGEPTVTLGEAMALAADRDLIARQYAVGFADVFDAAVPALRDGLRHTGTLEGGIVFAQLTLMAARPDTLIARKRGHLEAFVAGQRAQAALDAGWPFTRAGRSAIAALETWLRAEGHARNPGATADLLAAGLFVALRQGDVPLPPPWPWPVEYVRNHETHERHEKRQQ
jgi:triphosphoribosyl-dephospho-CoA synthase